MRNFFEHTRNPQGLGGKIMVSMMNRGHASVARWGMQHLELKDGSLVLDAGCGSVFPAGWSLGWTTPL